MIENLEAILEAIGYSTNSPRKRHLVGGILLSMSFLFGGLAITIMTMKGDKNDG